MNHPSLTIVGSPDQLASVLALVASWTAPAAAPAPTMTPPPPMPAPAGAVPPMPPMPPHGGDEGEDDGAPIGAPPVLAPGTVDAANMPWDERIHAPSKTQNKDNTWRKKKGVDAATVAAVEAAYRNAGYHAPQPATPPPAAIPAPTMPPPPMPVAAIVPPMPVPTIPAPPVAAPSGDFSQFMAHLQTRMNEKDPATGMPLIDATYLAAKTQQIASAFGRPLTVITDIASDPNMINWAIQAMQLDGKW